MFHTPSFVTSFLISGCCLCATTAAFCNVAHALVKILHLRWGMGVVGGLWQWMLCATANDPCPGSKTKCYGTRAVWIVPSFEGLRRELKHSLTGNKITNISNAHPHYKWDYIVPKYRGPIVIYSAWKVCPNISPEHSKLKRIPKPSQDNIITA